jgi:hypothetical protein
VRLVLGVALGVVAMAPNLLDLSVSQSVPYLVLGSALIVALLCVVMVTLVGGGFTRRAWLEVAPSIFLVALVVFVSAGLWLPLGRWGPWSGDILVVGFVFYYLLELRGVVKTHPTWYAGLAIGGILVFISLAMADVEAAAANRQITNAGQALIWAAAQVFRSTALVDVKPITAPGEVLGFIVILTSVFFAAVLFSAITAWAVRQGAHRDREASGDEAIREQVLAALRQAGVVPAEPGPERPEDRCLVDIDWIAGTRRGAWWRSRRESNAEVLARIADSCDETQARRIVAVVQGDGRDDAERDRTHAIQVEATVDIVAYLSAEAHPGDTVVTARPELVDALTEEGIEVEAPDAFLGRLAGAQRSTP